MGGLVEVVEIEEIGLVLEVGIQPIVDLPCGEAAAVLRGGQVCGILDRYLIVAILVAIAVHCGFVTRFQYSCSRRDSAVSPLGFVLNLYLWENASAFYLNSEMRTERTRCSKGCVRGQIKGRSFRVGRRDGVYLSLYEFLKDLLSDCCRSVDKAKIERCVPGITYGQLDGSKLTVESF